MILFVASLLLALAEPGSTSDFDLGEDEFEVDGGEDEVGMVDYAAEAKKRPADPTHFHLEPEGKQPLKNDFPMQVVAIGPSWVKVELPVLVGTSPETFRKDYPHGLRVVTEWDIGGETTRREQRFTADQMWERQPTLAFFDVAVQDARRSAPVRVKVFSAALPGPPPEDQGAEAPPVPPLKERYAVTSVFFRAKE